MADTLVIGGGAVGTAIAYELARKGAEVTLVERGPDLCAECSYGNAGLICPSHAAPLPSPLALRQGIRWALKRDSPLYLKPRPAVAPWLIRFLAACTEGRARRGTELIRSLSLRSLELHAELAEELDTGLERRGVLNAYETETGFDRGQKEVAASREAGMRVESLPIAEARQLEPSLAPSLAGAIYYPDEAHCEPNRFVHALGEGAAALGVRIRTDVEVIGFRRGNGRVTSVETTAGEEPVGEVVIAAGSWTKELAAALGLFVPIEGGKGYHVEIDPPVDGPEIPVFMQESRVIATPLPDRVRLAGTLELAGLDMSIDHVRVAAIVRAAERNVPSLGARRVRAVWRGLRPCAPDGLPIVGRPEKYENVVLATGHAMMGITLAPITGRLVAELIAGEEPAVDPAPLSPNRFHSFLPRRPAREPAPTAGPAPVESEPPGHPGP
jgi:D-amino-acid dehydrogenase